MSSPIKSYNCCWSSDFWVGEPHLPSGGPHLNTLSCECRTKFSPRFIGCSHQRQLSHPQIQACSEKPTSQVCPCLRGLVPPARAGEGRDVATGTHTRPHAKPWLRAWTRVTGRWGRCHPIVRHRATHPGTPRPGVCTAPRNLLLKNFSCSNVFFYIITLLKQIKMILSLTYRN